MEKIGHRAEKGFLERIIINLYANASILGNSKKPINKFSPHHALSIPRKLPQSTQLCTRRTLQEGWGGRSDQVDRCPAPKHYRVEENREAKEK